MSLPPEIVFMGSFAFLQIDWLSLKLLAAEEKGSLYIGEKILIVLNICQIRSSRDNLRIIFLIFH